ncbi:kinetochore Sim4 complex subunit Fta4 [Boeremia exigua]|uniref:kinetochore Sim4 complex subunit Fta4 n=1 Tax=Boeremia exigua TaxID=749465 RepID=UPI001E8CC714|nr:kinetochore Sim4 complex subunit Fta4 [Boeremia exigua]KAH6625148.1 kinetochore Sim4 complex subunit Fta4 [Boeremia exigua]
MSKQGTVVEQKQFFLQAKKHHLSRPIVPSQRLKTIAEDGGIELGVVKGALDKVNRDLKQHSRKVYSRQMIDHIVDQIDELYWQSGARDIDDEDDDAAPEDDGNTLYQNDNLTLDENIAKLPNVWDTSSDSTTSRDVDQDDYTAALARLQDLSAQRLSLQTKLTTYRTLLSLLEPYRKPKENIQPNLVWRDAPLAPELAKTRTLAIRVAGRVGEKLGDVQVPATADEDGDVDMLALKGQGKKKLDAILAGW